MFDTTKYYEAIKTMASNEKKLQEDAEYEYSDDTEEVAKDDWFEKEKLKQETIKKKLAEERVQEQKEAIAETLAKEATTTEAEFERQREKDDLAAALKDEL
jgi:hypothetical protein